MTVPVPKVVLAWVHRRGGATEPGSPAGSTADLGDLHLWAPQDVQGAVLAQRDPRHRSTSV